MKIPLTFIHTHFTHSLLNTKEDILKNAGNQNILVSNDFHCMDIYVPKQMKNHKRFGMTWGWVYYDRMLILADYTFNITFFALY